MSICSFDLNKKSMSFSGAARPILLYRGGNLLLVKNSPDSIGGYISERKIFETKTIELQQGDIIYMFSDGYHDQFGGKNGKKMQMKGFIKFVESIVNFPMEKQHQLLSEHFYFWMGDEFQIDDVLVIGIKI
jgi:serine phosphatase RsbU (regulator of sigma subunit)